jgi:hypothetical protein
LEPTIFGVLQSFILEKILVLHKTCEQWGVANNFSKRKFWEHWIEKETCIYFHVDHQGNKQNKIKSSMKWIGSIQFNWTLTKEKQNVYAFVNYSF